MSEREKLYANENPSTHPLTPSGYPIEILEVAIPRKDARKNILIALIVALILHLIGTLIIAPHILLNSNQPQKTDFESMNEKDLQRFKRRFKEKSATPAAITHGVSSGIRDKRSCEKCTNDG